ncbi:hypothetical protein MB02_10150 [Croceicoccus estronivorus]|nr:hypothetical protein MB02_10150 [Croceicoccus estronivorus]
MVYPAAITTVANNALNGLKRLARDPSGLPANGALLLGERSRLLGLKKGGRMSANGSCCLLDAYDGRIALNLARADDWDLLPALLDGECPDNWQKLAAAIHVRSVAALVERGMELGLPIAAERMPYAAEPWTFSSAGTTRGRTTPLVVDLSSLWAGPLAASLLGAMGAKVIKVESIARPDGARRGNRQFYDLLNAEKASVALDFDSVSGRRQLRNLIDSADIVIEGSRPRALRHLGINAEELVAQGMIWVSITAHGRYGKAGERIGFGDDAAIAGGISAFMGAYWGIPMFAGDAIADPLAGLHAALAAWTCWSKGSGGLISVSLADGVRHALHYHAAAAEELPHWQAMAQHDAAPMYPMRSSPSARALGADNDSVPAC